MSRNNIFKYLEEKSADRRFDGIKKLAEGYCFVKHVHKYDEFGEEYYSSYNKTIENVADDYMYLWKSRHFIHNCYELRVESGVTENDYSANKMLLYLEYFSNLINLIDLKSDKEIYLERKEYVMLKEDIEQLVSYLQHQLIYNDEDESVIIAEINPVATAAANLVDIEIAMKIFKYNHYLMKGDLKNKRDILLSIANSFESIKSELKKYNQAAIVDKVGFLLNNINIRHNNLEGSGKKEFTANMNEKELENWYDTAYDVLLLAILTHDYIKNVKPKIENLQTYYS